ncbi:MAG: dihydrofolate reductase [Leptospiraceae bacterium]|nr:dihydrofolate reductase [Leptospiraceae bacterium]MCP5493478.1 dihydrofolate reductase [Leptospiraceae bacterium]
MQASVYIATSLDGFIARENGDLDWLQGSDGEAQENSEDFGFQSFMDSVDVLVMGRNTFEKVQSFGQWPYGEKLVIVLSSKPLQIPIGLGKIESIFCSPKELVKKLSEKGAKHLYIDGGKTIQSFLKEGLIHQLTITRVPILLGHGISLFGSIIDHDILLKHIETKSYTNGFVQSKYEVCR